MLTTIRTSCWQNTFEWSIHRERSNQFIINRDATVVYIKHLLQFPSTTCFKFERVTWTEMHIMQWSLLCMRKRSFWLIPFTKIQCRTRNESRYSFSSATRTLTFTISKRYSTISAFQRILFQSMACCYQCFNGAPGHLFLFTWQVRVWDRWNAFPQTLHLKGLPSKWISKCFFSSFFDTNAAPHCLHLKGFSPIWRL